MISTAEPAIISWGAPAGWRGQAVLDFAEFPMLDLPWEMRMRDGLREGIRCVKSGRTRRVLRIDAAASRAELGARPGAVLFAKRYLTNTLRRRFSAALIGGKAQREFRLMRGMIARGIPTPEPLAWVERRRPFAARAAESANYLLTLEWRHDASLKGCLESGRPDAGEILAAAARFIATAHAAGFYHDDLSAEHILARFAVSPPGGIAPGGSLAPSFAFIDVDNGRLSDGAVRSGARALNLFQILRSVSRAAVPVPAREAFVAAYADAYADAFAGARAKGVKGMGGTPVPAADLRRKISAIARRKIGRGVF